MFAILKFFASPGFDIVDFVRNFKDDLLSGQPTHAAIAGSLVFGVFVLLSYMVFRKDNTQIQKKAKKNASKAKKKKDKNEKSEGNANEEIEETMLKEEGNDEGALSTSERKTRTKKKKSAKDKNAAEEGEKENTGKDTSNELGDDDDEDDQGKWSVVVSKKRLNSKSKDS